LGRWNKPISTSETYAALSKFVPGAEKGAPTPAKLISQLKTILEQKAPSRTTYGRIVSIPDAKRSELATIAGEITKLCRDPDNVVSYKDFEFLKVLGTVSVEAKPLGAGGGGTVYKGTLKPLNGPSQSVVLKEPKSRDPTADSTLLSQLLLVELICSSFVAFFFFFLFFFFFFW
jgi:hypothetical protein